MRDDNTNTPYEKRPEELRTLQNWLVSEIFFRVGNACSCILFMLIRSQVSTKISLQQRSYLQEFANINYGVQNAEGAKNMDYLH